VTAGPILVVKNRRYAGDIFPAGVPSGLRVYSERSALDGLKAPIVLLGPGLSERTIRAARAIARYSGGDVFVLGGQP
jgi:hypothetical protein